MSLPRCKLGTGYHKQIQHKATISETLINQEEKDKLASTLMNTKGKKKVNFEMYSCVHMIRTIRTYFIDLRI